MDGPGATRARFKMKMVIRFLLLLAIAVPVFAADELRPIQIPANSTIAITVGVATSNTKLPTLPFGGEQILLVNATSATIFFNFGNAATTVAIPTGTAGGAPVPPGIVMTVTRPEGATHIATISGTAAQTLYVSAGGGQ